MSEFTHKIQAKFRRYHRYKAALLRILPQIGEFSRYVKTCKDNFFLICCQVVMISLRRTWCGFKVHAMYGCYLDNPVFKIVHDVLSVVTLRGPADHHHSL